MHAYLAPILDSTYTEEEVDENGDAVSVNVTARTIGCRSESGEVVPLPVSVSCVSIQCDVPTPGIATVITEHMLVELPNGWVVST